MTASQLKSSPKLNPLPHSESLEDIHFNIAQEITRAMTTTYSSPSSSSTTPSAILTPPLRPIPLQSPLQQPLQSPPYHSPPRRPQSPVKIQSRAPISKPSPAEEELVRRIHRKVGGPSKLSTYDDPAKVRHVVIEALALEQTNNSDAARIRKGQLTVFERRVVRTVTNRGAAVRSRMRQRKEVAHLKNELRSRDCRVRALENVVRMMCSKYAAPLPEVMKEGEEENVPDLALDQELFGSLVDQVITHPAWC